MKGGGEQAKFYRETTLAVFLPLAACVSLRLQAGPHVCIAK